MFKVVLLVLESLLVFLNSCFFILFWLNVISTFCSKSLIWVLVSFPSLLVPYSVSFNSLFIAFTSSSILWPYSVIPMNILITSVLNSASDRLAISLSLSSIFGIFDPFFHLFHTSLSRCTCYVVRGGALCIRQSRATHMAVLWLCMWRKGLRGNSASCSALGWLSVTSSPTHKQIGLFWSTIYYCIVLIIHTVLQSIMST